MKRVTLVVVLACTVGFSAAARADDGTTTGDLGMMKEQLKADLKVEQHQRR